MSEYKNKIVLGAVLAVIIAIGMAGAAIYIAPTQSTSTLGQSSQVSTSQSQLSSTSQPAVTSQVTTSQEVATSQQVATSLQSTQSTTQAIASPQSSLVVQLTDPPIVPAGTTSLNLTYSAITLLVAEPVSTSSSTTTSASTSSTTTTSKSTTSASLVTTETVTLPVTGGSATVNLLKLENISQTVAAPSLPNGTEVYSVSFVVTSISINVSGTISPVTLATGGNTLQITLTNPAVVEGTLGLLLELNPTIVSTSSGYQMIPASVGIVLPQSEITSNYHQVGSTHNVTIQDQNTIKQLFGNVTAKVVSISVSGNKSTISVQVTNSGNYSSDIVSLAVSGNFTLQGCVTTTTTTTTSSHGNFAPPKQSCVNRDSIAFVPVSPSTTTSTSKTTTSATTSTTTTTTSSTATTCSTGTMTLGNAPNAWSPKSELTLAAGQCITLTFSGTITTGPISIFGQHGVDVLVPTSTNPQEYTVQLCVLSIVPPTPCMQPFASMMGCQGGQGNGNQGGQGNNGNGNGQGNNGNH